MKKEGHILIHTEKKTILIWVRLKGVSNIAAQQKQITNAAFWEDAAGREEAYVWRSSHYRLSL